MPQWAARSNEWQQRHSCLLRSPAQWRLTACAEHCFRFYAALMTWLHSCAAAGALHPRVPAGIRARMVAFLGALQAGARSGFGAAGGPWEFNLRDLLRWCSMLEGALPAAAPEHRSAPPLLVVHHD